MILDKKPVPLAEVESYVTNLEEKKSLHSYIKKFSKLTKEKAKSMAESIRALNNPKINEEDIVEILDFLPEDAEDLNKIFTEVSLSEEESNVILEIVKKH